MNNRTPFDETSSSLAQPTEWNEYDIVDEIQTQVRGMKRKLVVLDDDPTGVQTVHDIYVFTQWDKPLLREAFLDERPLFFILTNTRSMGAQEAAAINREIANNVLEVASDEDYEVEFISRSDSTLRGHYPLEIDILSEVTLKLVGRGYDGHLLVPAFFEAGRYTYSDVHYLKEGEHLTPVHLTEFAKDKVFGYDNSDLRLWVAEKTEGRFLPEQCVSISLEQLRQGPDVVEDVLLTVENNVPIIINAMSYTDIHVLSLALHRARNRGKRFIYRTAASFVKSYVGMRDNPYLTGDMMIAKESERHGGVIVVGSHTDKTTSQLRNLLEGMEILPYEINVDLIIDDQERLRELDRISAEINRQIIIGNDVVIFSSRKLVSADDKAGNLRISQLVSSSLVNLIERLEVTPRFIIAKGGITSSDVATKGLMVKKAKVLGQATAGIPVWQTEEETRFPNMAYIIFPGNVGSDTTLLEIVRNISGSRSEGDKC